MDKGRLDKVRECTEEAEALLRQWVSGATDEPGAREIVLAAQAYAALAMVHVKMGDWPLSADDDLGVAKGAGMMEG